MNVTNVKIKKANTKTNFAFQVPFSNDSKPFSANHARSWKRISFKMAPGDYLNEMKRYFENNSRTKDFIAHTAKVAI